MSKRVFVLLCVVCVIVLGTASVGLAVPDPDHGSEISDIARDTPPGPGHGAIVSEAARNRDNAAALSFDGIDDHVSFASPVVPIGAKSIEFWMNSTGTGEEFATIARTSYGSQYGVNPGDSGVFICMQGPNAYGIAEGTLRFGVSSGETYAFRLNSNSQVDDGAWHHVVAEWDGTTSEGGAKLFIDGELDASATADHLEVGPSLLNLDIGRYYADGVYTEREEQMRYVGALDEFRVWDTAISQEQILRNMSKKLGSADGLIANWRFDEGSGTVAFDDSGNGNGGVIYGAPAWVGAAF